MKRVLILLLFPFFVSAQNVVTIGEASTSNVVVVPPTIITTSGNVVVVSPTVIVSSGNVVVMPPCATEPVTPTGDALILEWDNIANVPVADAESVSNWNTFFGLPTNGDVFTSVTVVGNSVYLYGGGDMTLTNGETGYVCGQIGGNAQLFENNTHIVGIDDQAGVIVAVADACFYGAELVGEECTPVSILEYFNSNSCTTVGNSAFLGCTSLTSMAAGITTVGTAAFANCTSLTSMAAGITTVGTAAFVNCTSLTSMAAGITTVGDGAFNGCTSLTSMAAGITTVGTAAFANCTSLTSMAAGITTVGDNAFVGCTSLTSMLIPLCTALGTDCVDNGVFAEITGLTITVTCDASLLTCNAGAPDGDLCTLAANNTITVNGAPLAGCGGD